MSLVLYPHNLRTLDEFVYDLSLSQSYRHLRRGLQALGFGDIAGARLWFEQARERATTDDQIRVSNRAIEFLDEPTPDKDSIGAFFSPLADLFAGD